MQGLVRVCKRVSVTLRDRHNVMSFYNVTRTRTRYLTMRYGRRLRQQKEGKLAHNHKCLS